MKPIINIEDAMEWLEEKCDKSETAEEQEIVEWIMEMLWQYDDLRNS